MALREILLKFPDISDLEFKNLEALQSKPEYIVDLLKLLKFGDTSFVSSVAIKNYVKTHWMVSFILGFLIIFLI